MLTPDENKMIEAIFNRYHCERITPTEDFVAQACFDIGWLTGMVGKLERELEDIRNIR